MNLKTLNLNKNSKDGYNFVRPFSIPRQSFNLLDNWCLFAINVNYFDWGQWRKTIHNSLIYIYLILRYNMVGNIKFSLIIVAGFIIFRDPIKIEQIFAIIFVMMGNIFLRFWNSGKPRVVYSEKFQQCWDGYNIKFSSLTNFIFLDSYK